MKVSALQMYGTVKGTRILTIKIQTEIKMHPPTSPLQLLVIGVVVLVLFGRGKVSSLMGEVGRGISAFKKGLSDPASETEPDQALAALEKVKSPAIKASD